MYKIGLERSLLLVFWYLLCFDLLLWYFANSTSGFPKNKLCRYFLLLFYSFVFGTSLLFLANYILEGRIK